MNKKFEVAIAMSAGAEKIEKKEIIQELWSGYGQIIRYETSNFDIPNVIVKYISYPNKSNHPRGWNTDISHQRKLTSYKIETEWYENWASECSSKCRVPKCLAIETEGRKMLIVLEDLDFAGFSGRKRSVSMNDVRNCLRWLANFHATFLNRSPVGLWENGTYWHLDTRPDELVALTDERLRFAATKIDLKLKNCQFKTIVHGDAKLANFCFDIAGEKVAMVDFQYVGGGCGMKDIAYFVGSCFHESECEQYEDELLDYYFKVLKMAVEEKHENIDLTVLEKEWREMYYYAWADFHRFLKGWSPGHWKLNSYSERVVDQIIEKLES
jgi:hypothetical protein